MDEAEVCVASSLECSMPYIMAPPISTYTTTTANRISRVLVSMSKASPHTNTIKSLLQVSYERQTFSIFHKPHKLSSPIEIHSTLYIYIHVHLPCVGILKSKGGLLDRDSLLFKMWVDFVVFQNVLLGI